jgi:alanine racemase
VDIRSLRPTVVEVSLDRLAENFRAVQAAVAPAAVMPILKANAYGHGLDSVSLRVPAVSTAAPARAL